MKNHERLLRAGLCVSFALWTLATASALRAAETDVEPAAILVDAARALVGTVAPAPRLETLDGTIIDLQALRGDKAIYLKFWATWCGPCRRQMPHFESVYQNAGDELAVIAINAGFNDNLDDIRDYREELGIHMPIVVDDGTLAGAFNLRITPQHIVIGKDGSIKHIGNLADAELDAALARESAAPDLPAPARTETFTAAARLDRGDLLPAESLPSTATIAPGAPRGTVLVFMIPWCESYLASTRPAQAAACKEVREQLEILKRQHPDVRWLGIASGIWTVPHDLDVYAENSQVTLPLALDADGEWFRRFGVTTVPTVIVADASGRIVERIEGHDPALNDTIATL